MIITNYFLKIKDKHTKLNQEININIKKDEEITSIVVPDSNNKSDGKQVLAQDNKNDAVETNRKESDHEKSNILITHQETPNFELQEEEYLNEMFKEIEELVQKKKKYS